MSFFVFLFGLILGSFLNAVIYRLEQGESALHGRSYCPHCKHALSWQDLIPVLSFVLLQGKCRYCKQKISFQYPFVEISTGFLFLFIFNYQVSSLNQVSGLEILNALYLWVIACLLIVLFVYDLKHYILPDKILFPAIGIAVFYRVIQSQEFNQIFDPFFAALGAAGFFFFIFALSKGHAMGFGDVKLALFMGLFLGWPNILVALFVAFMAGAVVGVTLLFFKKKGMKSEVPFGPFLIAGTFIALFWGSRVVDWYLTLVLV